MIWSSFSVATRPVIDDWRLARVVGWLYMATAVVYLVVMTR